jgi:stage IV sporulation protein FB
MLLEPDRTPYDLSFHLFGTPVRIAPWFWLVSIIFGWEFVNLGLQYLAIWVACVFVSILLHEFGHVWAGKAFGTDGSIVLYSFGGLAIGASDLRPRWQRVVVYLTGPGIQLALYGALLLTEYRIGEKGMENMPEPAYITFGILKSINLYWPLLNLLPIWPLDGGKVTREICSALSRDGVRISLGISIAVAGFIAVHALIANHNANYRIPYLPLGMFTALFFGALAFESYQLLQQTKFLHYEPPDDRLPWE